MSWSATEVIAKLSQGLTQSSITIYREKLAKQIPRNLTISNTSGAIIDLTSGSSRSPTPWQPPSPAPLREPDVPGAGGQSGFAPRKKKSQLGSQNFRSAPIWHFMTSTFVPTPWRQSTRILPQQDPSYGCTSSMWCNLGDSSQCFNTCPQSIRLYTIGRRYLNIH